MTSGGVSIYLGSQEAMSAQTELFKLGLIELSLNPNPWIDGAHFNQSLDLATGTVNLQLGAVRISVWVDANQDILRLTAEGPTPFSIRVKSSSTRPADTTWNHGSAATCAPSQSNPVSACMETFLRAKVNQEHR